MRNQNDWDSYEGHANPFNGNPFHHWGDFSRGWGGPGSRMARGDISPIILKLLQEKPMHGYEIIKTLEERSHGFWRPSAGSVYPILQLLEDQDYVSVSEQDGKKIYTITDSGIAEAKIERPELPWERFRHQFPVKLIKEVMPHIAGLKHSMRHVMMSGSADDQKAVVDIIKKAADDIEKIAGKLETK